MLGENSKCHLSMISYLEIILIFIEEISNRICDLYEKLSRLSEDDYDIVAYPLEKYTA